MGIFSSLNSPNVQGLPKSYFGGSSGIVLTLPADNYSFAVFSHPTKLPVGQGEENNCCVGPQMHCIGSDF